jgi:hypothetical protein
VVIGSSRLIVDVDGHYLDLHVHAPVNDDPVGTWFAAAGRSVYPPTFQQGGNMTAVASRGLPFVFIDPPACARPTDEYTVASVKTSAKTIGYSAATAILLFAALSDGCPWSGISTTNDRSRT